MSRADLEWREGIAGEAAHDAFVRDVFAMPPPERILRPQWHAFGVFERDGRCIAAAETAALTLLTNGTETRVAGLRLVGVVEAWRGQGLFRRLTERALRDDGPVLLYAAEPALYERFGFAPVFQFAFAGPAPEPVAAPPARPLDRAADGALVHRMLADRAPVSREAAILDAPGLFLDRLAADPDLRLAHLPGADAILAYEEDGDALVLVDVVARAMPTLPAILGALPRRYARVRALFPPDRLEWSGEPEPDDTGLMARGMLPLRGPFRLPPTTEF